MILALSIAAAAGTMVAKVLMARRNRWGFLVQVLNCGPWIWLTIATGAAGMHAITVLTFVTAVYGWRRWGQLDKEETT